MVAFRRPGEDGAGPIPSAVSSKRAPVPNHPRTVSTPTRVNFTDDNAPERPIIFGSVPHTRKPVSPACRDRRALSPVIGGVAMLALVVVFSAAVGTLALGYTERVEETRPPQVDIDFVVEENGPNHDLILPVYETGEPIETDHLAVVSTKPIDIDADRNGIAYGWTSTTESFTEQAGNSPPDAELGNTWTAGESVWIGANGDLEGETVRIVWNSQPIQGQNPGSVEGENSHVLAEYTVGESGG